MLINKTVRDLGDEWAGAGVSATQHNGRHARVKLGVLTGSQKLAAGLAEFGRFCVWKMASHSADPIQRVFSPIHLHAYYGNQV